MEYVEITVKSETGLGENTAYDKMPRLESYSGEVYHDVGPVVQGVIVPVCVRILTLLTADLVEQMTIQAGQETALPSLGNVKNMTQNTQKTISPIIPLWNLGPG